MDAYDLTLRLMTTNDSWFPSVESYVMPDLPVNMFAQLNNGKRYTLNSDSIMSGFNSMDGITSWPYFAGWHPDTEEQYEEVLNLYISNATQAKLVYDYYYPVSDFINASVAWYVLNGDACVTCPTLKLNQMIYGQIHNEEYVYQWRTPAAPYLAPHGSELGFVFNCKGYCSYFEIQWSDSLSYSMMSAWTNFAKHGVPNITNHEYGLNVQWSAYDSGSNVMLLDDQLGMVQGFQSGYRNDACDFWYNEVGYDTMNAICVNSLSVQAQESGTHDSKKSPSTLLYCNCEGCQNVGM